MDVHHYFKQRQKDLQKDNVKHIFSYYRDNFVAFYPKLKDRMIWLPYHVNTKVFRDYKFEKTIDMLMMGDISKQLYPLRNKIYHTLKADHRFVYHEHPGYRNFDDNEENVFVGLNYAKEINRAKIFFTCDSVFNYPVSKYYQVLASNTLLLASESNELKDLGFVDGENFIAITEHNFVGKANYYLNNEPERLRIAKNGYEMVHQKHTTSMRAQQLVDHIKKIINQYE